MDFVDNDSFITTVQNIFSGFPELHLYKYWVCAMAKADETHVRSQAGPCRIYGGQGATWTSFSANTVVFAIYSPTRYTM